MVDGLPGFLEGCFWAVLTLVAILVIVVALIRGMQWLMGL